MTKILKKDKPIDDKVLISRTRVNKHNWNQLGRLGEVLTSSIKKEVNKEILLDLAIESLLRYYSELLNKNMPRGRATPEEVLRASGETVIRPTSARARDEFSRFTNTTGSTFRFTGDQAQELDETNE